MKQLKLQVRSCFCSFHLPFHLLEVCSFEVWSDEFVKMPSLFCYLFLCRCNLAEKTCATRTWFCCFSIKRKGWQFHLARCSFFQLLQVLILKYVCQEIDCQVDMHITGHGVVVWAVSEGMRDHRWEKQLERSVWKGLDTWAPSMPMRVKCLVRQT